MKVLYAVNSENKSFEIEEDDDINVLIGDIRSHIDDDINAQGIVVSESDYFFSRLINKFFQNVDEECNLVDLGNITALTGASSSDEE